MNKLRSFIATMLFALFSMTAMADDYQYLTISGTDSESSFTVSKIQKITFDATNMILLMTDGTEQALPLTSLQKMFFSSTPSGIATVGTTLSKMQFEGGMLRAEVARGETVAIYNMKGEQVFSANESGTFDISRLQRGVYIVKVGSQTKKVINK